MKVTEINEIYNLLVDDFFIWCHLQCQIICHDSCTAQGCTFSSESLKKDLQHNCYYWLIYVLKNWNRAHLSVLLKNICNIIIIMVDNVLKNWNWACVNMSVKLQMHKCPRGGPHYINNLTCGELFRPGFASIFLTKLKWAIYNWLYLFPSITEAHIPLV